ncbi:MAG: hypothetical protein K1060chlam1_01515 [Candidatus Anoxychlamydiales bacterium]|nr:hypothetical protein [Candidatus Anoxychlamydiales bacterium]
MAAISSKTYNIFTYGVEKATQVEDKVTTFAKKTFDSIRNFNLQQIKDGFTKAYNFTKENKFTIALAAISLAISGVVFVNVSATMAILFLGTVSFVKAYAYTRAHVKSADYQFKKLAKDYIHSLENICRINKDGEKLTNDLETGKVETKFYNLQKELMLFIDNNACTNERLLSWQKYLTNLNPKLLLFTRSFPHFSAFKTINEVFKKRSSVWLENYIEKLFEYMLTKDTIDFEKKLEGLIKDLDSTSSTLQENISEKSKEVEGSFSTDETKQAIVLKLYDGMKKSTPPPAPSSSSTSSAPEPVAVPPPLDIPSAVVPVKPNPTPPTPPTSSASTAEPSLAAVPAKPLPTPPTPSSPSSVSTAPKPAAVPAKPLPTPPTSSASKPAAPIPATDPPPTKSASTAAPSPAAVSAKDDLNLDALPLPPLSQEAVDGLKALDTSSSTTSTLPPTTAQSSGFQALKNLFSK